MLKQKYCLRTVAAKNAEMETKFSLTPPMAHEEPGLYRIETEKPLMFAKPDEDILDDEEYGDDNDEDEKTSPRNLCCCSTGNTGGNRSSSGSGTSRGYCADCCGCLLCEQPASRRRKRRKRQTCAICCRRTIAFFFSHVGLCSLVVAYSIAGGLIFSQLESMNELRERNNVAHTRRNMVARLWNYTRSVKLLYPKVWTRDTDLLLQEFQTIIYAAIKEKGWDGKEGEREMQWSFTGSLLYSVTVITTIGYGNIAPKTAYGRLVTIFYAMVGIPLTLLCLANLGGLFGNCFRFLYKHTCRFCVWACLPSGYTRTNKRKTKRDPLPEVKGLASLGELEERDDLNERHDPTTVETEVSVADDDDSSEDIERIRVPISVCFLLMVVYILGGAMLFSLWEANWSYLVGSYFCFITLSTIGFGDFVPGTSTNSWSNKQKSVLCALYLIFGLALIAMCFNLLQEEVRTKCRWLAQKLRLVDRNSNRK